MATATWIESASRGQKRPVGADRVEGGWHTLSLARADEERHERDRAATRRVVIHHAGAGAVPDVLDALGLDPLTEEEAAALVMERERCRDPDGLALERMPQLRPDLAESMQELIHLIATACGVGREDRDGQDDD